MPLEAIEFPLNHPPFIIQDVKADNFTQQRFFNTNSVLRLKTKIKAILAG